jgi:hypothetical protein
MKKVDWSVLAMGFWFNPGKWREVEEEIRKRRRIL